MTDFETAVQNLIDVMVDHDAWLRAENEALAGIASDLYFLIKPNASIPVDWVFATLTTVVSGYLRARRGIRETEKDPAARDSRLARANDVAVRNLKLLPANGQDPELTALGTKVPAVSGEEGFRLVADYLAKILKIHYRRFSDPKSFFPAPAPPTTPARAIPFDVPAAVPENVPENVPTSRPSPQAQSSRPAPVPQAAPAPPRPVISGGQQALPDIHSKDYPMIRVALKPLTPDTGAIFENVMDSVRKLNFFKAASGQKLEMAIKVGAPEVAELLSYEPNAFLTKILRQKADHTPDKRAVVVTGTPAVEYKGKFGVLALVKIAERVQFKTFEFAFEIEDAARAVPAKPTGKAAPGPGENFSRAERGAVIRESNLSVVAACSRGRYHASARKQCEDRFYFSVNTPTGWNAFAVADGAENARHSGKGAELASVAACKYFLHYFSNKNVCDFFEKKARTLEEWSGHFAANFYNDSYFLVNKYRNGLELDKLIYSVVYKTYMTIADEVAMKSKVSAEPAALSDYDSTLTLLAFKKFDFGYFLISFLMGDGCAALFDWNGSGRVMPLGTPDSAASEGTAACLTRPGEVTPEKVKNKTFFAFAKSFETLILATDGVTDPFFQTARDFSDEKKWLKFHEETLKKGANDIKGASGLFSRNASIEEKVASLAAWIDFDSPGHNDDRAMIIIR